MYTLQVNLQECKKKVIIALIYKRSFFAMLLKTTNTPEV